MKIFVMTILFAFSNIAFGGSVSINGKSYTCAGSINMSNNSVTCDGKPINSGAGSAGPCIGSQTKKAANGSGQIDVLASVPSEARVDGTICGSVTMDKTAIVQRNASVNGEFKLAKGALIKSGATLNGSGRIGDNVVIGEGATLNGDVNIANSNIARGTTLNGNLNIDGVTLSGDLVCNGNGNIMASPPADSAH